MNCIMKKITKYRNLKNKNKIYIDNIFNIFNLLHYYYQEVAMLVINTSLISL